MRFLGAVVRVDGIMVTPPSPRKLLLGRRINFRTVEDTGVEPHLNNHRAFGLGEGTESADLTRIGNLVLNTLGNNRIAMGMSALANAKILGRLDHLVRRIRVGSLEGIADLLIGNEDLLLGLVVLQSGRPNQLLGVLEPSVSAVDEGRYVMVRFTEHKVVNVVSKGDAQLCTTSLDVRDQYFENVLRPGTACDNTLVEPPSWDDLPVHLDVAIPLVHG